MKKPKTPKSPKKKLPKYEGGGNAGKELKNTALFLADTILAEWAPNAIKQDQYGDTKWGKNLGNVAAVHESFDSQSPISKNVSKMWNDGETGYTEEQKKLYGQIQPIAKTGSKIGEMWTGAAIGGAGMGAGASGAGNAAAGSGQMAGQVFSQGSKQFLNTQYDPMLNMKSNKDSNITGTNAYGMEQTNPYYAQGGVTQPNAEVEKQENIITPNGDFGQFNGPSHEQGGIPTNLPEGTKVFSDRLKMPKTGKTFAQLNKANNTTKEDKILEDTKSNSVAKATASLMKLAKEKSSNELFTAQEALKQSKLNNYTKRLGGIQQYPDGGKVDAQGFPIDAQGRRLTATEQLGYSRPGYTYGNSTVQGNVSYPGINPNTANANLGLQNAGGNTNPIINYPQVGFGYQAGNTSPYIQPTNMTDAEFIAKQQTRLNLPKQAYGGKFELGGNQRLKEINSEEPELLDPKAFGYANFQDWGDLNRAEFGDTRPKAESTNNQSNVNWGNIATQAGLGIANNLGNIYDLNRAKDVEVDKYDRMNPSLLDPTASLRDVDMQRKIAEYNIRNASTGHAGAYLANRTGSDVSLALTKDKIQREYQNANAGIKNNAQMYNIEQHKAEDIANMQNRAQARNIKANAISKIGSNTVGQYKDTQMTKADMDKIELIKTMYPAIKNNKEMMAYYKSKYPNFNWEEIEK